VKETENKYFLNLLPYNARRFFANWNLRFYEKYAFPDIVSLDNPLNNPTQFLVTKQVIKDTSQRMGRKINLVITAVGTGAIVDLVEKDREELQEYIQSITLTDLKDFDLNRWKLLSDSGIELKKEIGNLLQSRFIEKLHGDLFYGNELFGDFPNRFVYKKKGHFYDIWLRVYTKDRLPKLIKPVVKTMLRSIYYRNKFPEIFTPSIGKILRFQISFKRRVFDRELEYFYQRYPDNSIIAIADSSYPILYYMYEQLPPKGALLFHDYGFFSRENLHLIENFLRPDNQNNQFVRNYYGEFTTDPSFDYTYYKISNQVKKLSIKKTVERVSQVTGQSPILVNLDGEERTADFFLEIIRERFQVWNIQENVDISDSVVNYVNGLKKQMDLLEETLANIYNSITPQLNENYQLTIKKILLGYFNDDDHRFLTIEIQK